MTLRRLVNVAYAVLAETLPRELRNELGRRLDVAAAESQPQPADATMTAADKASANKAAMASLLGMLPGGRPRTA